MILSLRCKLLSSLLGPKTPPHFIIYWYSWCQWVSGSFLSADNTSSEGLLSSQDETGLLKGLGKMSRNPIWMLLSSASLQRWLFPEAQWHERLRVVLPSGILTQTSLCNPILKGILWGREAWFWLHRHTQQMQNDHVQLTDKNQDVIHSPTKQHSTGSRLVKHSAHWPTDSTRPATEGSPPSGAGQGPDPGCPLEEKGSREWRHTRLAGSSSQHGTWATANLELQQNWMTLDIGFR